MADTYVQAIRLKVFAPVYALVLNFRSPEGRHPVIKAGCRRLAGVHPSSGDEDGRNTGDQSSVGKRAGVDNCRLWWRRRDQQCGQLGDTTADQRPDADAQPVTGTYAIAKSDTVAEPNAHAVSDAVTHTHADTVANANANANA